MKYGVTGAGKTHTIFGSMGSKGTKELGVIAFTIAQLLSYDEITYSFSYMEIYNEKLSDLLSEKDNLAI